MLSHQSIRKSNDIELSQQKENDIAFTFLPDRRVSHYFHGWNASCVSFARQTACDVSMTRRQRKQPESRRRTGCWTCKGTVHTKTPPFMHQRRCSVPPAVGWIPCISSVLLSFVALMILLMLTGNLGVDLLVGRREACAMYGGKTALQSMRTAESRLRPGAKAALERRCIAKRDSVRP